jgi:hypothetical protein
MSYGYLIVTHCPARFLEQDRQHRFVLSAQSEGLCFYSRLDETGGLSNRNQSQSMITDTGVEYLSRITPPFYFSDFLLTHRQGESDLIEVCKKRIKLNDFDVIRLRVQRDLRINRVYAVLS